MRLSLIIPMFNAGDFISSCLDSFMRSVSSRDDTEVIVIDDGSTDKCTDIVERYCDEYSFIHLFKQQNSGPGAARNVGIREAKGDYVWFVDADDWIADEAIEDILNIELACIENDPDILAFGSIDYESDCSTKRDIFSYPEDYDTDGISHLLKYNESIRCCPPYYLFRKEFLNSNSLSFIPGIFHEDAEFFPRVFFYAKRIRISSRIYYGRRLHELSITHSITGKRVSDTLTVLSSLHKFHISEIKGNICEKSFCSFISNIANNGCKLAIQIGGKTREDFDKAIYKAGWLNRNLLRSSKMKYILEGLLLTIFPRHYSTIHQFLLKLKP